MSSEDKHQSSINEGDGDAEKAAQESPPPSKNLDGFIEDDGGLNRKPQDTRVNEGHGKKTQPRESNFASGPSIDVTVKDMPTSVKEFMKSTTSYLSRISRQLEVLSWIGFAICMYVSGIKYQADSITDMIVFMALALLFANNGIRLPDSISGSIVKRLTRIAE